MSKPSQVAHLFKVTYLLIKFGTYNQNVPVPARGKTGNFYGHFVWEEGYGGHVLRVESKDWERIAKDLMTKSRQLVPPVVAIEIEPTGEVAATLDELTQLRHTHGFTMARLEDALQAFGELSARVNQDADVRRKLDMVLALPGAPTEAQLAAAIAAEAQEMQRLATEARAADPLEQYEHLAQGGKPLPQQPMEVSDDPERALLEAKSHRDLRDMCRAHNAAGVGPKIPLTSPKKDDMVDALLMIGRVAA